MFNHISFTTIVTVLLSIGMWNWSPTWAQESRETAAPKASPASATQPADSKESAEPKPDQPLVKAQLISDMAAIRPGQAFHVGVLYTITPDWHLYWINPGDSGMTTEVQFQLPTGFRSGPVQWPVPKVFTPMKDHRNYGYEKQVLLWIRVQPPPGLKPGQKLTISASSLWLACKVACVPGSAELTLELSVAERAKTSEHRAAFDKFITQTPVHYQADKSPATVIFAGGLPEGRTSGHITLEVKWKEQVTAVEVFAGTDEVVMVESLTCQTRDQATSIGFDLRLLPGLTPKNSTFPIVVAYHDATGVRRGLIIPIRLPNTRTQEPTGP